MRSRVMILITAILLTACSHVRTIQVGAHEFPRDFAPHWSYEVEWWYQTGVLNDGKFGYEFTLFRMHRPSYEWWPKIFGVPIGDVWVVHVMVHDYEEGRRIFLEKAIPPVFGIAVQGVGTSSDSLDFHYYSRDISFDFYGNLENMYLTVLTDSVALDLALSPKKSPVFHGDDGVVSMEEGTSVYYSITNIDVIGTIVIDGREIHVEGKSWMDGQWGDFDASPWDWFSFRMENGVEVMLFHFPRSDLKYGTFVDGNGRVKKIYDFTLSMMGSIEDPEGDEVPIPMPAIIEIPSLGITLIATAVTPDQFNQSEYTPTYWEGLCEAEMRIGSKEIKGWAFFEGWR